MLFPVSILYAASNQSHYATAWVLTTDAPDALEGRLAGSPHLRALRIHSIDRRSPTMLLLQRWVDREDVLNTSRGEPSSRQGQAL